MKSSVEQSIFSRAELILCISPRPNFGRFKHTGVDTAKKAFWALDKEKMKLNRYRKLDF